MIAVCLYHSSAHLHLRPVSVSLSKEWHNSQPGGCQNFKDVKLRVSLISIWICIISLTYSNTKISWGALHRLDKGWEFIHQCNNDPVKHKPSLFSICIHSPLSRHNGSITGSCLWDVRAGWLGTRCLVVASLNVSSKWLRSLFSEENSWWKLWSPLPS